MKDNKNSLQELKQILGNDYEIVNKTIEEKKQTGGKKNV